MSFAGAHPSCPYHHRLGGEDSCTLRREKPSNYLFGFVWADGGHAINHPTTYLPSKQALIHKLDPRAYLRSSVFLRRGAVANTRNARVVVGVETDDAEEMDMASRGSLECRARALKAILRV